MESRFYRSWHRPWSTASLRAYRHVLRTLQLARHIPANDEHDLRGYDARRMDGHLHG